MKMNKNKAALFFALALGAGLGGFSAASLADNDPPAAKGKAAKPAPDDHALMERCEELMREHMKGGMEGHGMGGMGMGGMTGEGMMEGHGMGRMHMVMALNLTDDQRAKINKLHDEMRHNNWEREGAIQDESAKLRDLYEADTRDPKAIDAEYAKIFDVKRQIIQNMVETENRVEALLTPDQLKELKEMRHHHGGMHEQPMIK